MREAPPANGYVKVIKTGEKGSDVNLATHLLVDGYNDEYELAVVVSNDSDLVAPIQIVITELKKPVGLLNPAKHPSQVLQNCVTFQKKIRAGVLKNCQFPPILTDSIGSFAKPSSW